MQSTESSAVILREWAQSSGKKTLGSNKNRSWESKIYVEQKYLFFQLVWFALWWVWVLQGLSSLFGFSLLQSLRVHLFSPLRTEDAIIRTREEQ